MKLADGSMINVRASGDLDIKYGEKIYLNPIEERIHRFDANGLTM